MNTIKGMLGIKTSAQKAQEKAQAEALTTQKRAANAAIEDAAVARSDPSQSGRRLRGLGRRSLAFMGSELGVSGPLVGGNA